MKLSTKQTLIKALAAAFVLTAAGGTVLAINSMTANKAESPFNGVYNGTLTAFAEETTPSEGTEPATQVNNFVLKKMISVDNNYMLLATSISNVTEYKGLGYYITENGLTQNKAGDIYYTGIQVKTDNDGGTHTYSMSDIYGAEYSYKNAGMIVCEIPYTESAEYAVKPYLVKNDDTVVYGENGYKEGTNPNVLKNGSFENGIDGWTRSNEALGNVSSDKNYWLNDEERAAGYAFGMDGNYMFSAYAPGSAESAKGTLTSSTFTLGGSGWITFKLGGAKNYDQVYLEVLEKGVDTDTVIARYYNSEWKDRTDGVKSGCTLTAYKADLSAYKDQNKELYIRVTDNAESDYGLFFLDSVQTYHKDEPTEGATALNILYNVVNGGFEKDTDGWTVETTEGPVNEVFGAIGNADAKWGENRSYNNDGKFFRNMNEVCKGYLMSSAFIVSENGWMTFKLGGSKAHSYVSIIDAKTGAELARFVNEKYVGAWPNNGWEMYSYKVNLIESGIAAGTEVRIKVVDGATKDYGVVIVDSFVTCYDQEPEGTRIQNCKPDYSLVNGSFETGNLDGWTMNGDLGLVTDTEINAGWYTKNDATKDGKYLFTFVDANDRNHEGGEGSLKSSNFILKKDGTIAFKFGGAGSDAGAGLNRNVYVQICKADGTVIAKFYNDKEGRKNTELVDYYYTFSLEEDCECYFEVVDIAKDGSYRCFVLDGVAVNCSVPEGYTLATNQLG